MSIGTVLAVASIATTAVSTIAQMRQAKAKKEMYDMQANAARIQGKITALKYKQEGVEKLKKINRVLAANTARAAAGNIDPFSSGGSPDIINTYSLRQAVNDFTISRDNQTMATKMANIQAQQYNYAGKVAVKSAQTAALTSMGKSITSAAMLYGGSAFASADSIFTGSATTAPSSNLLNLNTTYSSPTAIV